MPLSLWRHVCGRSQVCCTIQLSRLAYYTQSCAASDQWQVWWPDSSGSIEHVPVCLAVFMSSAMQWVYVWHTCMVFGLDLVICRLSCKFDWSAEWFRSVSMCASGFHRICNCICAIANDWHTHIFPQHVWPASSKAICCIYDMSCISTIQRRACAIIIKASVWPLDPFASQFGSSIQLPASLTSFQHPTSCLYHRRHQ